MMTDMDFGISVGRGSEDRTADRFAVADAAYLYATAIDTIGNSSATGASDGGVAEATALLSRCLTSDAELRLFLAGPSGPWQPLGPGGPAGVAAAVRAYFTAYGYVGTQHSVGNIRIAFTNTDAAIATSQIPCFHWLADERMLLAPVSYRDEFVREDGVWRIAKRDIYAMRFWVAAGYAPDPLDPSLARGN
jgi:hypothetical protein